MKQFWKDRIALGFAAAGVVLMVFTLAWRINPVEGSVVPDFLFNNPLGVAVFWVLFVTCMPVYIACMTLTVMLLGDPAPEWLGRWFPQWVLADYCLMFCLQGIVHFLFGKLVSVCVRKWLRPKDKTKQTHGLNI